MAISITKPTVGGSENTWGATLNQALDDIVDALNGVSSVTPDINGGTIDGATIGGSSAAAGTFTNLTATGNIAVSGTVDGRDVATDGAKLDGIESGATADQTAAEIRALVETATDSNVFTDADHSKLNGIEAGANVTDTANVTAAGALMDSELTNIAAVKALNQGVSTTDSPTFARVITDEIQAHPTANGGDLLFKDNSSNAIYYYDDSAQTWLWRTDGINEKMRINATGLSIKTQASPAVALDVSGSIQYTGTITDVSDDRLKENKVQITGALDKIAALTGYTYNMVYEDADQTEMGVIAQDVQAVLPVAVKNISLDTDGDGTAEDYLGVSYIQLIAPMIEAIKELKARVEQLEAQ